MFPIERLLEILCSNVQDYGVHQPTHTCVGLVRVVHGADHRVVSGMDDVGHIKVGHRENPGCARPSLRADRLAVRLQLDPTGGGKLRIVQILFLILLLILILFLLLLFLLLLLLCVPPRPKPQYSRSFVIPGSGTGYLPSGPGFKGAGESMVSLSIPGANSWSELRICS